MVLIHINSPKPETESYRVLKKWCRKFDKETFETWEQAFNFALRKHRQEFRVFKQSTFEWYWLYNKEIIKVGKINELKGE